MSTPDVQGPAKLPGNSDGIDLDAIKARAAAATKGPWIAEPEDAGENHYTPARVWAVTESDYWSSDVSEMQLAAGGPNDMEFIAAARSDVPALVAEVERLRAEQSEVLAVIRKYLPEAIGFNTLPEIVAGIARQRDFQHEVKDHLAETAQRLTTERDAALARIRAVEDVMRQVFWPVQFADPVRDRFRTALSTPETGDPE